MGKDWDSLDTWTPAIDSPKRLVKGTQPNFRRQGHGKEQQEWHQAWATEALRVLKPGGHLLAFGGTRTYHRLVCAVEDAGFEIRDTISWLYGSGFPKSLDVGKQIDKRGGANIGWFGPWLREERERRGITAKALCAAIGEHGAVNHGGAVSNWEKGFNLPTADQFNRICTELDLPFESLAEAERQKVGDGVGAGSRGNTFPLAPEYDLTAPATPEAERWEGWGTALKPAHEPVVVARKPLSGTVSQTVLEHGTGALNVDGCRVGHASDADLAESQAKNPGRDDLVSSDVYGNGRPQQSVNAAGRWPANVCLSHSPGCVQVGTRKVKSSQPATFHRAAAENDGNTSAAYGKESRPEGHVTPGYGGADGTETVGAWSCTPECPVRLLDEQTGEVGNNGNNGDPPGGNKFSGVYGDGMPERGGPPRPRDKGGASRFFYVAKASRAERSAGLNGTADGDRKICVCPDPEIPMDPEPLRGTDAATGTVASDLSTTGSGNSITDPSPAGSRSTTSTGTEKTTDSKTSNSSQPSTISEPTPPTSDATMPASGSDAATSAASGSSPTLSTTTSAPRVGPSTDAADPAISPRSSPTNSSAVCADCGGVVQGALRNSHPT